MDWRKARTLLLATFTAANLLLGYLLVRPNSAASGLALSGRWQLREVKAQLAAQGLVLSASLPSRGPMLPFLRVAAPAPHLTQQLVALLQEGLAPTAASGTSTGTVTAAPDGTVTFLSEVPVGGKVRLDRRGAVRKAAEAFLRENGILQVADLRWSRTYRAGADRAVVEYLPYYQGEAVFAGLVRVGVTSEGIRDVVAFLPRIEGFRGEPKGVLPAAEASLRLAGHVRAMRVESVSRSASASDDPDMPASQRPAVMLSRAPSLASPLPELADPRYRPVTEQAERPSQPIQTLQLTRVSIGYFAMPTPGAESWDTVPTWRFTAETGEVFYVNAFTGELEGPK